MLIYLFLLLLLFKIFLDTKYEANKWLNQFTSRAVQKQIEIKNTVQVNILFVSTTSLFLNINSLL